MTNNLIVECREDCGNAPRKEILRDLTVAYAKKDVNSYLEWLRDDIIWDIVGDKQIQGLHNVDETLQQMNEQEIIELHIHNIITHGNTASLNGTFILSNKEKTAFCDVYHFAGFTKKAKIKGITSYIINNA